MSCTTSYPTLACLKLKGIEIGIEKQHGNIAWAASLPVPTTGLVYGCLLSDERSVPASALHCCCCLDGTSLRSCLQDWAALAWTEHGQADSPAWEISKEAGFYKRHFHLTSLNIFQFQNTHLKITYRNIYMDTERNFPALGIQPTAHGRACNCLPVQSLFACY